MDNFLLLLLLNKDSHDAGGAWHANMLKFSMYNGPSVAE